MIRTEQLVEQLSNAVRGRSRAERDARLDRGCGDSAGLGQPVEERLGAEQDDAASTVDWSPAASALDRGPLPRHPSGTGNGRFTPGQIIAGRFTVVRYVARGGMGEVYEVKDRFLQGVHVALKVIRPEIADDPNCSRRFEQEVLLARKVVHPNLCPIYDIAHSDDPPPPFLFLTMKLLTGETLSSRMQRPEPIEREQATAIFRQMVEGLAALHAAGIIHRDIKPNNVMLDSSGPELRLSIMDFGLARLHEPDETLGAHSLVAGTPGYMAPEVLQGPSKAADIFALGVLLQEVLTRERPAATVGAPVQPSPALDTADAPAALVAAVKEFLATEPGRRCIAFEAIQSALTSDRGVGLWDTEMVANAPRRLWSRREFAIGSAIAASAMAGGVAWKWDRLYDMLHPLPAKRFVALLGWPPPGDPRIEPTITAVVDAVGSELARAEAFDHDLFIIPQHIGKNVASLAQLNEVRQSVGANLVLSASAMVSGTELQLLLRVLDPAASRTLRQRSIKVPLDEQLSIPNKAVLVAADLLGITGYKPDEQRSKVGTSNPEAYAAFQAAEALRAQENDTGLDEAIEKYKRAIEIDPGYAVAQMRLAWAYLRLYGLHRNSGALGLARANCTSAISLNPDLVDAHVGLASVYRHAGDTEAAGKEITIALGLDPSNAHTLIYQADFYAEDNQWDDAKNTFKRIFKLRPNYWLAHNECGAVMEDEGDYSGALGEFQAASLAAPRNALALKNVGSAYLDLGRIPEAMQNLNASFSLNPDDHAAVALAEAFRVQHKYPDAIAYAERAVKLNPNERDNWLELGDVYTSAGRAGTDAMAAYNQAAMVQEEKLRTTPKDGPGWMVQAFCSAKKGEPDKALTLMAKAESFHAKDMQSQLYKVRLLELVGRRNDALATIASCLVRGPVRFKIESLPDIERLRRSPEFEKIMASTASPA
jgi:serine/threonine protein kinase/Tfp pilus assembly protein PilF